MRVLIVEDDIQIASFLIKGLKQAGFIPMHAADGQQGLRLALTEPQCRDGGQSVPPKAIA